MRPNNGLFVRALATAALIALPAASMAATRPLSASAYHNVSQSGSLCKQGPGAIRLGPQLAPFAVLAGTTITNAGNSLVTYSPIMPRSFSGQIYNDAVGVWPGTAVTGFYPPGLDTDGVSAIYAAGYDGNRAAPMFAENVLSRVSTTMAGMAPTALLSGDLSQAKVPGYPMGTLPPGVYKVNTTAGIMAGNLTLRGAGGTAPPSVFIFQIGTTLTTTGNAGLGGNIVLTNGANACNVFWQVGTSATLGGQTFYGSVFANTSITVGATTLTGRALAINGAVTVTSAGGTLITNPGGR
jgi:hypothetical protein